MKSKPTPRILARFPQWVVTPGGLSCTSFPYFIEKKDLGDSDWLTHMRGKTWVNMAAFETALERAREIHGVR